MNKTDCQEQPPRATSPASLAGKISGCCLSYAKAHKLAATWVALMTDNACEISRVEDRPYGRVFYFILQDSGPDDVSSHMAGHAPIIIDRIDGEIKSHGHRLSYRTLPEAIRSRSTCCQA